MRIAVSKIRSTERRGRESYLKEVGREVGKEVR